MDFTNSEIDKLLNEGTTTLNKDKRIAIYKQYQNLMQELVPIHLLYFSKQAYGTLEQRPRHAAEHVPAVRATVDEQGLGQLELDAGSARTTTRGGAGSAPPLLCPGPDVPGSVPAPWG